MRAQHQSENKQSQNKAGHFDQRARTEKLMSCLQKESNYLNHIAQLTPGPSCVKIITHDREIES
jgi:hypothetical protein